ncbi:MAG: TetR/AcrR family transcriptional regulator, partial [Bacteroidota bacterium]|nr:TetR/AcrR family transcriptional regulator [Bacteroidota bacterium]
MGISERKEREKEQRKNDIIDAAEKIFFKKGLSNSTMDEVAKEAELSKGTLYLYFKSKEEIYFEIKLRAVNILNRMFKKSILPEKTGFENCTEIGKTYVKFLNDYSNYFKVMVYFESTDCKICDFKDKCENFFKDDNPLNSFIQII